MGRRSPIASLVPACGKRGFATRVQAEREAKRHAHQRRGKAGCERCRRGYQYAAFVCPHPEAGNEHWHVGHAWSKQMARSMRRHLWKMMIRAGRAGEDEQGGD